MSKLINLSVDVDKIDKNKLFKGKKGTYLKLTIAVNDTKDNYGNDVSCWEEQTEEERNNKTSKNYLGNGKIFWSNDKEPVGSESDFNADENNHEDSLPF
jgi:hypothetical protein